MKEKTLISYFFVFVIFNVSASVVELPDSSLIDEAIQESFACRKNNPALSVSIVKDGKIVFANGYGVQSLDDKQPVTNTTLFGIASLTKTFTSTLLAKLTDKSKEYSLNSRIAEFYGNQNVFDGYLRAKFATIRDLLAHRMGIPMHNFINFDSKLNRKNLIRRLKELKPKGRFRDSFYYSNIMYGQAARLAEKIGTGKYEDLITNELFREIGMMDSGFFTTANESTIELAKGYLDVYGKLHPVPFELSKKWSELCGANCIISSAIDMAKWMLFHLNHGKNQDGKRVMSESALEETHKPENVLAKSALSKYFTKPHVPETFSQTGYGMGWRTGHYRGYDMLTHTGSSWGYKNMISMFPDMNLGIYTAMTGDDEDFMFRYSLHQYLADMYMGNTPWLNSSLICSFPEPWLPAKAPRTKPNISKDLKPQRKLDEYLGVYENPAYGDIEIFILDDENSTNKLIAVYGYVDLIMYPKGKNEEFFFETDGIGAMLINFGTVQFKTRNGVVDKMRIPTFEPKDPPIFKKKNLPHPKSRNLSPDETTTGPPTETSTHSESVNGVTDNTDGDTANTAEGIPDTLSESQSGISNAEQEVVKSSIPSTKATEVKSGSTNPKQELVQSSETVLIKTQDVKPVVTNTGVDVTKSSSQSGKAATEENSSITNTKPKVIKSDASATGTTKEKSSLQNESSSATDAAKDLIKPKSTAKKELVEPIMDSSNTSTQTKTEKSQESPKGNPVQQ